MTSDPDSGRHCMIYVTAGSRAEALQIARALVDERLAACANISGGPAHRCEAADSNV